MTTIQPEYCLENFKYSNGGVIPEIENNFLNCVQQILIKTNNCVKAKST